MSSQKKSFREQLTSFSDPTPKMERDPEEQFSLTDSNWKSYDSRLDDEAAAQKPSKVAPKKGKPLRDISIEEGKYAGKPTSRSQRESQSALPKLNIKPKPISKKSNIGLLGLGKRKQQEPESEEESSEEEEQQEDSDEEQETPEVRAKMDDLFSFFDKIESDGELDEEEIDEMDKMVDSEERPKAKSKKQIGRQQLERNADYDEDEDLDEDEGDEDDDEEDEDDEDDDEEEEDDNLISENNQLSGLGGDAQKEAEELERMLKQQEKEIVTLDKKDEVEELENAKQTKNQMSLWTNLLELRIRLQKALSSGNSFPQNETLLAFKTKNPKINIKFEEITESLNGLMDDLSDLRTMTTKQYKETKEINLAEPPTKKRKISSSSEWYSKITQDEETLKPFLEETINKWNSRTQITSGQAFNKLKSVNKTVLEQVNMMMLEKDRLRRRAQTKRTHFKIFGQIEDKTSTQQNQQPPPEENGTQPKAAQTQLAKQTKQKEQAIVDSEIFDDTDFYQLLLKEIVESSNEEDMALAQALAAPKIKRKVKRSGSSMSKNRRLNYSVHEKLVGFMAPQEWNVESTWRTGELFGALFQNPTFS